MIFFLKWGGERIDITENIYQASGEHISASSSNFIRYSPSTTGGCARRAGSRLSVFAAFTKLLLLPTCSIELTRGENCCSMCRRR